MSERDVFLAAREHADPVARAAYLDRACAGDAGLRQRVERLLAADATHDKALDIPFLPTAPYGKAEPAGFSFLAPPARPDALGRLGRYHVLSLLGRGGFGLVFRAIDPALGRVVAIKVLSATLATPDARRRFLREARAAAAVRHENVVQIHDVEEQPLPYVVMECITGGTLHALLERGPLPPVQAVAVARQIARGLAAAHARGLIHRDVTPANVLLEEGPAGKVKLADFGLARFADAEQTQPGMIVGTPAYLAPEQAQGGLVDARADLFSLGCILYRACAGVPPFAGADARATLLAVISQQPRPLRQCAPHVPAALVRLIERLLSKDAKDRHASADEVEAELAALERHSQDEPTQELAPPSRPRRGVLTLAALFGLAVLIALGVAAFWRRGTDARVEQPDVPAKDKEPVEEPPPPPPPWEPTPEQKKFIDFVARQAPEQRAAAVAAKLAAVNGLPWSDVLLFEPKDGPPTSCRLHDGYRKADTPRVANRLRLIWPLAALTTLRSVDLRHTGVTDFAPLSALPLTDLKADVVLDNLDAQKAILSIPTLKTINGVPVAEYAERRQRLRQEIGDFAPLAKERTDDEVAKWLAEKIRTLNPGFDNPVQARPDADRNSVAVQSRKAGGRLAHFRFTKDTFDLTPLLALDVRELHLAGIDVNDLTPLRNLKLEKLFLYRVPIDDVSAFARMPLTLLEMREVPVATVEPLARLKLESYLERSTGVRDAHLLDLRAMRKFECSPVADLSFLAGAPLEELTARLRIDFEPEERMLKGLPLRTINGTPAAEFWRKRAERRKANQAAAAALAALPKEQQADALKAAVRVGGTAEPHVELVRDEGDAVVEVSLRDPANRQDVLAALSAFASLRKLAVRCPNYHREIDLSPLAGLPLEEIVLGPLAAPNLPVLRAMPRLKTIDGRPAKEVLAALSEPAKK